MKTQCAVVFAVVLAMAQEPGGTAAELHAAAVQAYRAKDFARFRDLEKRALALEPDVPRYAYNVACGDALTGDRKEALRLLNALVDRKLDLGADADDDFAALRESPEWASFAARLAELRKPVVHSSIGFTLDDPALLAVGMEADRATGDLYIASVRERKILRRTKAGEVSDFIRSGQDGFLAGASLAIDATRHLLFASTSAVPFMRGYKQEDEGQTGLFEFDLRSGKLVHKAMLPPDGKVHFLNALAISREGDAYVSDSGTAGVYRLRRGTESLESIFPAGLFRATQGIALSDDERTMIVADFSDGLWAVDLATKKRRRIPGPAGVWLGGLDGLTRVPGGFISVQIGAPPNRVLRLHLDARWDRITGVDLLERNHPDYDGPVQGTVAGGAFWYVANSQLSLGNGQTGAFAAEQARPTVVLKLPL